MRIHGGRGLELNVKKRCKKTHGSLLTWPRLLMPALLSDTRAPQLPGTITVHYSSGVFDSVCVCVVRACLEVVKQQKANKYGPNDRLHPLQEWWGGRFSWEERPRGDDGTHMWLPGVFNSVSATLNHHKVTLFSIQLLQPSINPDEAAGLCSKTSQRTLSFSLLNSPRLPVHALFLLRLSIQSQ